jgi:CubicO group peptidase (beta-lactamase class C family)
MKELLTIILFASLSINSWANPTDLNLKIDALFSSINLNNSPACSVGVIEAGKFIHSSGYGLANLEHSIRNTTDTVFRIGSVSKQFTAMSIAILEERDALSFNDSLQQYIPDLIDYEEEVTLNHVIHHFSGLGDYEYSDYPNRFFNAVGEQFRWGNEDYMSNEEIHSLFKTLPLIMRPETKFWYSNLGYGLLSMVIENLSGMTLRQFANKEIFKPLGMNVSFFNDNVNLVVKNRADGYSQREGYPGEYEINMTNLSNVGDGGVYTSINDFIKWDQNFYNNKLGKKSYELIDVMERNFFDTAGADIEIAQDIKRDEYSYAFAQNIDYRNGYKRWSHSGSWVAYTAQYSRFPEIEFSVITLCNNEAIHASDIADEIMEIYFRQHKALGE